MTFLQQIPLFTSGSGGYFRYRIPALVVSQSGTILAFCEGRRFTGQDSDQIDLLLRRSPTAVLPLRNLTASFQKKVGYAATRQRLSTKRRV
jgi:hypothetical protein